MATIWFILMMMVIFFGMAWLAEFLRQIFLYVFYNDQRAKRVLMIVLVVPVFMAGLYVFVEYICFLFTCLVVWGMDYLFGF